MKHLFRTYFLPKSPFWQDRRLVTAIPFVWLSMFFLVPCFLIFKISFSESVLAIPPFKPILEWSGDMILHFQFNLGTYWRLITDPFYASGFFTSITVAFFATILCLVLGYWIAYSMAQASPRWRPLLMLLIILPFWTSFLVRVYAWMGLLSNDGVLNAVLLKLGLISEPKQFLFNNFAVMLGIVYCYLPFMVLPIYIAIEKIDSAYLEAAFDLGCRPRHAFWRITVPLSMSGVISGVILVFIPAIGEYVIPELLGAPDTLMIGRIIWLEFFNNRDWPVASTVTVVMLLLLVVPIVLLQRWRLQKQGEL
jgi:putrescine transport system permease protein